MHWKLVLLLSCLTLNPVIKGDVKINYFVKNYANKDNLDIRLRKCESFSFLGDHCDPTFQFTAYTTNNRGERIVSLKREVGPFRNARFIEMVMETSQIQQVFPDTIEFELDIHDSDADNDQRIALFTRKVPITKVGEIELQLGVDVRVDLVIQVECADEYYGHRCETYCQPYSGLWTCHEVTGARVCAKPCVHGSCVLTSTSAVCVCASGWSGEFCRMPVDSSLISSLILPEMPSESHNQPIPEIKIEETVDAETLSNVYLPASIESSSSTASLLTSVPVITTTTIKPSNLIIETISTTTSVFTNHEEIQEKLKNKAEEESRSFETTISVLPPFSTKATTANTSEIWLFQPESVTTSLTGTMNTSTKQTDKQEAINVNSNETMVKHAVGYSTRSSSIYLIVLTTLSVVIIWALLIVAIAFLVHRRRKRKTTKNASHSGSIWTNTSYEFSSNSTHCGSPIYKASPTHKYMNTLSSYTSGGTGSVRTLSSGSRGLNGTRGCLPKLPTDDHNELESVRYTAPPIITGNRIRFAAPKVDPLPPKAAELPCMTDPYDELTYLGDDYAVWEPEAPAKVPLTSFQ